MAPLHSHLNFEGQWGGGLLKWDASKTMLKTAPGKTYTTSQSFMTTDELCRTDTHRIVYYTDMVLFVYNTVCFSEGRF